MFDSLLWVLPHFVTHYAGQTTQGDTNDGDGVDQASGSKDAPKQDTSLPQRVYPLRLKRPLQESSTHDQSDALAPADLQPEKECGGGHGYGKYPSHVHSTNHNQNSSHPSRMIFPNPMKCHFLFVWESQSYVKGKGRLDIDDAREHSQGNRKWDDISETARYST
ncbi:hypothetical protein BASA61_005733 [Batrachochytrium salamandrivorans]|nr:hypothetical protein BASA61_005733 [Batrachochytrium salamandrivorans]